jgi:aspartate racemase
MKTIGLIGGMSWESTAVYYRLLNEMARNALGGLHSAELLLWSFDFAEIESLQDSGHWGEATRHMIDAARSLERGGADCIVICTNTMHLMAEAVQQAVDIPLIHIADATAAAISKTEVRHPLLLATRYTMEQDFYTGRLRQNHGIEAMVPDEQDRKTIHGIIYHELCQGVIKPESKDRFLSIAEKHIEAGVDGIILGCTEVGLLINQQDFEVPVFDTTQIHARAALGFALEG